MKFFSRRNSEADLDAELRAYLDLLTAENVRAGMTPQGARRAALLRLEGMAQVKEQCRDVRPFYWLTGLWQDVRCAFRSIRKHPGFTAVALLSLALGIGANAAIFSLFYNALIRPLPYRSDAQLIFIGRNMDGGQPFVASPEFAGWRANIRGLEGVAATGRDDYNMTGTGTPERVHAAVVTTNFLTVLGVTPAIGRDFTAAEGRPGNPGVALLTDAIWKRLFGRSPSAVGKVVSLNDRAYTVTGILPRHFRVPGDDEVDLIVPFQGAGFAWADQRLMILQVFGRVRPGVTLRQAAAELQAITERDRASIPPFFQHALLRNPLVLVPLRDWLVGDRRPALAALLGAVGLLLLIACVNVANLQLARAAERQREIGLRAALGASRARLARWLIVENLTLSAMAGVLGIAVAYALTALLQHAPGFPLAGSSDLHTGWIRWAATFALSALAGLAAGLAPALAGPRLELNEILKRSALSVAGGHRAHLRSALVTTQIALALALLVGAGLLLRSMDRVLSVGFGFRAENLLTLQMRLPPSRYSTVVKRDQFVDALLGNVRTLPGVESAAVTTALPLTGYTNLAAVLFEGQPAPPPGQRPNFSLSVVTPGYFHTMGIPLIAGRNFDRPSVGTPAAGSPAIVIVNQAFAKRFYPGDTATGKRIHLYGAPEFTTIAGVVADVRHKGRETAADPQLFVTSVPFPIPIVGLVIHTRNDPGSLVSAVRAAVWSVDKGQPVYDVQTMQSRVSENGGHRRTQTILLAAFGLLAMCLAAIGIYGVVSEAVSQRTREIGVRMALGADAKDVVRMVMRRSLALAVIGIAVGLGASLYLTRFLQSLIFGIKVTDALAFVGAGAVLLGVALLAGYIPARRASRIHPAAVLRSE
jgi:putative ABC transport system permease protein